MEEEAKLEDKAEMDDVSFSGEVKEREKDREISEELSE